MLSYNISYCIYRCFVVVHYFRTFVRKYESTKVQSTKVLSYESTESTKYESTFVRKYKVRKYFRTKVRKYKKVHYVRKYESIFVATS